jgi:hypothetical protein
MLTRTKSTAEKISLATGIRTLPSEKPTILATTLTQAEEMLESQTEASSTTSEVQDYFIFLSSISDHF